LISAWSAKGGAGTTVVTVGLAAALADRSGDDVLLVDLAGDLPAAMGMAEPAQGLSDWMLAGPDVTLDALARLEIETPVRNVSLLGLGGASGWLPDRLAAFVGLLAADQRLVVVDAGVLTRLGGDQIGLGEAVTSRADVSLLVTRACYLAMRRAINLGRHPDGVVVVRENGRALDSGDVERLLDAPLVARVDIDPAVARLVDSGLLASRPPRALTRSLRRVA
jgi:hypothetical protein